MFDTKLLRLFSEFFFSFSISDQFSAASDFGGIIDPFISQFYLTSEPGLYAIELSR